MQAERAGRAHIGQNSVLDRLADQFRRDVHAAGSQVVAEKIEDEEPIWRVDLTDGRSVWYVAGSGEIAREERVGRTRLRHESYTLPEDYSATIAVHASANPPLVRLTIAPTDASSRPGHEIRIDAVPGRDGRFAKQGTGRK